MKPIRYKVVYRNGDRIPVPIANLARDANGNFSFEYVDNPKYEFPGLESVRKFHQSDHLWEQIAFRVPNNVRAEHPNIPLEELLKETEGKLVTDHFEFLVE